MYPNPVPRRALLCMLRNLGYIHTNPSARHIYWEEQEMQITLVACKTMQLASSGGRFTWLQCTGHKAECVDSLQCRYTRVRCSPSTCLRPPVLYRPLEYPWNLMQVQLLDNGKPLVAWTLRPGFVIPDSSGLSYRVTIFWLSSCWRTLPLKEDSAPKVAGK